MLVLTVLSADVPAADSWDVQSDTWVATDALGRSLPTAEEVGLPRPKKNVGIFYFLWLNCNLGPFDISKILAADPKALEHPTSPPWGPRTQHHWGEPLFSYYHSTDESVLRKHAQMLGDAGIDVVIFDVTNGLTFPESWQALCRVFDQARREGNRVPQIAFLCPFVQPSKVVDDLWTQLYGKGLYQEMWFRWEGKPLILADPNSCGAVLMMPLPHEVGKGVESIPDNIQPNHTLGQTFVADRPFIAVSAFCATHMFTNCAVTMSLYRDGPQGDRLVSRRFFDLLDNASIRLTLKETLPPGKYYMELSKPKGKVSWWTFKPSFVHNGEAFADRTPAAGGRAIDFHSEKSFKETGDFFTFRKPRSSYFTGPLGPKEWCWLEVYPQHAFYKTPGVPEEVGVGIAQNACDRKVAAFSYPKSRGRSFCNGKQPEPKDQDTTGRNFTEQWRRALKIDPAFIFITGWNEWIAGDIGPTDFAGQHHPVTFVDAFNQEHSRDAEPMKGGHGDNYYYQMIANIRRFKGARPISPIRPRPSTIDGKFDDWKDVQPEFRDTIGDPVHRNHRGFGTDLHYVNKTGRNDIVAAKVSFDDVNVYFYVRTCDKLSPSTDTNWMLLFIDADRNPKTGWLGYDFAINRKVDDDQTCLQRNVGGKYEWETVAHVKYRTVGNEMELDIPRDLLSVKSLPTTLDFKWADNIQQTGDWSDFTLNGDAAPNDRYNYRAILK